MPTIEVLGRSLATAQWGDGEPEVVMLHDGLGSIQQWRDLPERLHVATGRTVLAYERAGHGSSTPTPSGPWPADWLHTEADVLASVLDSVRAHEPVLVGHSDGGSIALLAAAAGLPLDGVVTLAAHSFVEQVCVDEIERMRSEPHRWVSGLKRRHDHGAALFEAWSGVWTGDEFRGWDIRTRLGAITCPVLVVQGVDDEYATPDQATSTADAIGPNAESRLIPDIGHLLHRQAPDLVVELVADFVGRPTGGAS